MILANRGNPAGWPLFRSLPGGSPAWVQADAVRKQRRVQKYVVPRILKMFEEHEMLLLSAMGKNEEEGNGSTK